MTIGNPASNNRKQINGNGITSSIPIDWSFWDQTDLKVIHTDATGVDTVWTYGASPGSWAYTGGDGSTGTVTFTAADCASGERLTVIPAEKLDQPVDLDSGNINQVAIETAVDKLAARLQREAERVDRAPRMKESTTSSTPTFPEPSAGKVISWNTAGDDLENGPSVGDIEDAASNASAAASSAAAASTSETNAAASAAAAAASEQEVEDNLADALFESETLSPSGLKTLTVPDNTTISTFAQTLLDDTSQAAMQTTLGVDRFFYDVAALKASALTWTAGTLVYAGDYIYEAVASDGHITNAGSQQLIVIPINGNEYHMEAWAPASATELNSAIADAVLVVEASNTTATEETQRYVLKYSSYLEVDEQVTVTSSTSTMLYGADIDFSGAVLKAVSGGSLTATDPIFYFKIRDGYAKAPYCDGNKIASCAHAAGSIAADLYFPSSRRWAINDLAFGIRVDGSTDNACIKEAFARQWTANEATEWADDASWKGRALWVDGIDFQIQHFFGGSTGTPIYFGSTCSLLLCNGLHPFNGRGGDARTDPNLIECYASGPVFIDDSYFDNGLIHDYSGGNLIPQSSTYLELATAVTLTSPYMRVYCTASKDGQFPSYSHYSGNRNLSVDFFDDLTATYSWDGPFPAFSDLYDEMETGNVDLSVSQRKINLYLRGDDIAVEINRKPDGKFRKTYSHDDSSSIIEEFDPATNTWRVYTGSQTLVGLDENANLTGEAFKPITILAIGQSNMASVAGQSGGDQEEGHGVYLWDCNTHNAIVDGTQFNLASFGTSPISWPDGSGGYANNLGFQIAKALHEKTMRPVYMVIIARGAHKIESWMSDATLTANSWTRSTYNLYQMMQDNIPSALAAIPGSPTQFDVLAVHQGEANGTAGDDAALYATKLAAALDDIEGLGYIDLTKTKVVLGEISDQTGDDWWDGHRSALAMVADGRTGNAKNVTTVQSNGIDAISGDEVHFSGDGLTEYGRHYASAILGPSASKAITRTGLGGKVPFLVDAGAFQNISATNFYGVTSAKATSVGAPGSNGGTLLSEYWNNLYQFQTFHDVIDGDSYTNYLKNGVWQGWRKLLDDTDVQSSKSDTTSGALLTVGAGGLLTTTTAMYCADFNDQTLPSGFYYTDAATANIGELPSAFGVLRVERWNSSIVHFSWQRNAGLNPHEYRKMYTGSAWTPLKMVYQQDNIVGTVSQSGGVPTGSAFEKGSDTGYIYHKYADGRLEYIRNDAALAYVASADILTFTETMDVTFTSGPTMVSISLPTNAVNYTGVTLNDIGCQRGFVSGASLTAQLPRVFGAANFGSGDQIENCTIMVTGRWF